MSATTIEAVYENGVLRPLTAHDLREGERVRLSVEPHRPKVKASPEEILELLGKVYEGLSEEEIQEIEKHLRRPMSVFAAPDER